MPVEAEDSGADRLLDVLAHPPDEKRSKRQKGVNFKTNRFIDDSVGYMI